MKRYWQPYVMYWQSTLALNIDFHGLALIWSFHEKKNFGANASMTFIIMMQM